MAQQTAFSHVNLSDDTIRIGPLEVRFLITSENSGGSIAMFELLVGGTKGLPGPPHSHDHYEESIYGIDGVMTWTVNGKQIDIGPGQALCIPRPPFTGSITMEAGTRRRCAWSRQRKLVRSISARLPKCSTRRRVVRRTEQRWRRSCAATA